MENQEQTIKKQALNYGVLTGLALVGLGLLFFILDLSENKTVGYLSYAVLFIGIVLAANNYKTRHLHGFITFKQAFSTGFLTGLVASLITAMYAYIFFNYVAPEMVNTLIQNAEENLLRKKPDIKDEELDLAMLYTKKLMTPGGLSFSALLGNTFFSLIFALIAGLVIRKSEQPL